MTAITTGARMKRFSKRSCASLHLDAAPANALQNVSEGGTVVMLKNHQPPKVELAVIGTLSASQNGERFRLGGFLRSIALTDRRLLIRSRASKVGRGTLILGSESEV